MRLGNLLKCRVTGFQGIATGKAIYLNGCVQFNVCPPLKDDGSFIEGRWIDDAQLEVVGEGISVSAKEVGGPVSNTPKGMSHP